MRSKKPPTSKAPPWVMILEEMRSQNRATIEAVEASRVALAQRIDRLERDSKDRSTILELAVRELRHDVQQLQCDVRGFAEKVEALARIEKRVAAIERRTA